MSTPGKRIIITGISGVDVESSLKKFQIFANNSGRKVVYFCINDYIHSLEKTNRPNISWLELLTYPYKILIDLWTKALGDIIQKINKDPESDYFLVIHSCYYHQFTQEFISFVNLDLLKTFEATKIITLIDDADDIHIRLKLFKRIFATELGGASEKDVENLFELLKIIDWRANETLLSRFYSIQLTIPHFLLAVKHPLHTLFKLIFQDTEYKKIYLSHPISKIRSLLFEKNVSDADKQTEPITHITKYLSDKSICFYPTTIDELRLDAAKENIAYSKRWEENIYAGECLDLLYVNPSDKSFLPYNEQEIEKINIEDADKKIQFKYLLVNFLKEVSKQVGIRDKMLVEQSDALFVSRPYLNGKISDGVKTEIEYIKKLYPSNAKKLGIIYFPKEDKDDTKVYQTKEGIPTFLSMSKVFNLLSENEDICKETIVNEFASKIIEKFDQNETLVQILQEIVKRLLELGLIHRKTNYQEKALDSQTSYMLTKHYNEFANKLKSSYDVLLLDLEESFHVFEDEYQTNEVINKFLTT